MAGPGGAAQRVESKKSGWWIWLLTGIAVGVLGTIFLPDLLAPYLPSALRPADTEVAGVVQSKSAETDRLLLTVGSEAGATLVTFTEDVARFDQFIGVGDSVRLAVREYSPFIDDPEIRRVMKASDWRTQGAAAARGTDDRATTASPDSANGASVADDAVSGAETASEPDADSVPPAGEPTVEGEPDTSEVLP